VENPRIAGAGNPPEKSGTVRPSGIAEVHAVERIEELRPEFDLVRLRIRHREVLEQRQIQIHRRGSDQSVTSQLAECARSIRRESRGVEPLQDAVSTRSFTADGRVSDDIDAVAADAAEELSNPVVMFNGAPFA
jgi:hypothetical protein